MSPQRWFDKNELMPRLTWAIDMQARMAATMLVLQNDFYDFSTLYTTLPHNLIKEKLLDLIERTFYKKEGKLYLACNDKKAFFTSADH